MSDSKKTIFIVEDNVLNMKLFHDLLTFHGHNVIGTDDAISAVQQISSCYPDLILMDIQLQNGSGLDIIYDIKQSEHLNTIPIIAVTAFASKKDKEIILSKGCDDYISKPIDIYAFLEKIQLFLKKEASSQ